MGGIWEGRIGKGLVQTPNSRILVWSYHCRQFHEFLEHCVAWLVFAKATDTSHAFGNLNHNQNPGNGGTLKVDKVWENRILEGPLKLPRINPSPLRCFSVSVLPMGLQ